MKNLETVAWWLVVIGALNWGLVGLGSLMGGANWDLVQMVFGPVGLADLAYVVVGLSGVWLLWGKMGGK